MIQVSIFNTGVVLDPVYSTSVYGNVHNSN